MRVAPNLRKVLAAETRFEVKWFHATTVLVILIVAVCGLTFIIANDRYETRVRASYTLCEEDQTQDCVDFRGDGITINGTRYFSCDLVDVTPCFTYRVTGSDTLVYTISR